MKQLQKRVLRILLAALLVFTMLPLSGRIVYADDDTGNRPKITVEMGEGHEALAGKWAAYLNSDENKDQEEGAPYFCDASAEGSTVTLYYDKTKDPGVHDGWTEKEFSVDSLNEAQRILMDNLYYGVFPDYDHMDEGELLNSECLAQNPIDQYSSTDEIRNEILPEDEDKADLPEEMTFYAIWNTKTLNEVSLSIEQPVCGVTVVNKLFEEDPKPVVTVPDDANYYVSADHYWCDEDWYEEDYTFKGKESYHAKIWIKPALGYYFTDSTTAAAENAELARSDDLPSFTEGSNPYVDEGDTCVYLNVEAVHDWGEWKVTKEATQTEEGEKTRTCKGCGEKETQTIPVVYSCGIEVAPKTIEWTAEEGYKGATEEGLAEDAIKQVIKATSTGNDEVEFVVAGFKDMASYGQFDISAGGMEVTVGPKEGLTAGTYTCVVVISDWDDRFDDVEIPVTFTVTAKDIEYFDTAGAGTKWTKGSKEPASFIFKRSENDSETFAHFIGIQVDGKDVDAANYTAEPGSVIVKLKPAYLETLSGGDHKLTALFDDGNNVTVDFQISQNESENKNESVKKNENDNKNESVNTSSTVNKENTTTNAATTSGSKTEAVRTGDENSIMLWILLMIMSAAGMLLAMRKRLSQR